MLYIADMNKYDISGPSSELLKTFVTVARVGNVTQAADLLHKTQSAISVQIRKLEEQLAVELFLRHARGVQLSEEGRRLLPAAKKVLAEVERIGALFAQPLTGRVRVGIPDDYNETILEAALAQFGQKHQQVEVFVQSGCTAGYPEAIDNNQLDLAVCSAGPIPEKEAFFAEPSCWVSARDYRVSFDQPIPLAIFDRSCWWRDMATSELDQNQIRWRTAYLSANFSSIKAAIRTGLAVGVLAKSAVEDSMRVLTKKDGFPVLPETRLKLLKNATSTNDLVAAMGHAIHQAIR